MGVDRRVTISADQTSHHSNHWSRFSYLIEKKPKTGDEHGEKLSSQEFYARIIGCAKKISCRNKKLNKRATNELERLFKKEVFCKLKIGLVFVESNFCTSFALFVKLSFPFTNCSICSSLDIVAVNKNGQDRDADHSDSLAYSSQLKVIIRDNSCFTVDMYQFEKKEHEIPGITHEEVRLELAEADMVTFLGDFNYRLFGNLTMKQGTLFGKDALIGFEKRINSE